MTERKRHKKRMRARAQRMGNAKYTEALRAPAASVVGEAKLPGVADAAPDIVLGLDDFLARRAAAGADGVSERVREDEGEDYFADDFDTEECATEAEAKREVRAATWRGGEAAWAGRGSRWPAGGVPRRS